MYTNLDVRLVNIVIEGHHVSFFLILDSFTSWVGLGITFLMYVCLVSRCQVQKPCPALEILSLRDICSNDSFRSLNWIQLFHNTVGSKNLRKTVSLITVVKNKNTGKIQGPNSETRFDD
jgi:hypothetical protein